MNRKPERRKIGRVEKLQLAQVSHSPEEGVGVDLSTGRTLNLSTGGMRLELSQPIPLRTRVNVSLALGDDIVDVSGRVVYLEEIEEERIAVGLAFSNLSLTAEQAIERYLGSESLQTGEYYIDGDKVNDADSD